MTPRSKKPHGVPQALLRMSILTICGPVIYVAAAYGFAALIGKDRTQHVFNWAVAIGFYGLMAYLLIAAIIDFVHGPERPKD